MEARKIIIVSTKDQSKKIIMSSAETLSELKADLRTNNIDYTDMTFYEGTSKTELINNDSILPKDVPYKGTITNELVFMLTNTNKKIKSGSDDMSRTEIYNQIKLLNLQDECKKKFGKNFTLCKTSDLIDLIDNFDTESINDDKIEDKDHSAPTNCMCANITLKRAFIALLDILYDGGYILRGERIKIDNILNLEEVKTSPKESESSYSDNEINEMFSDLI